MRKARDFSKDDKEFVDNIILYSDLQRYEDNTGYYVFIFGLMTFVLVYLIVSL